MLEFLFRNGGKRTRKSDSFHEVIPPQKRGTEIVAEITQKPEAFRKFLRQILQSKLNGTSCGYRGAPLARGLRSFRRFWIMVFFDKNGIPASLRIEALLLKPCLEGTDSGWGRKTCEFFWMASDSDPKKCRSANYIGNYMKGELNVLLQ